MIISPLGLSQADLSVRDPGLPLVVLGERTSDGTFDHVGIDDVAAARDAVAHLLSLGRRRIAAIGDQPYATGEAAQLRTQGFRVAHAEAGLPVDESLVIQTARFNRADGARAMQRLLDRDDHPDAVFCFSDLVAAGAIHTILERGLRVPEDIAIIGYDDIEEGRYTRPTISTISQDKAAIAQLAVERLMLRISSSTPVPGVELLAQHRLRARQSTLGVAGALAERDRG
jgi:DNA-binding LacI/PurR family transcriptional regulator